MEKMDSDRDIDEEAQLSDLEVPRTGLNDDDVPSSSCPGPSSIGSGDASQQPWSFPGTSSAEAVQDHAKINSALNLNKLLNEKLTRLEKVLVGRLNECRQRLKDLHNLPAAGEKRERHETFRYLHCGKPYFKDKSNVSAPDNEDTILISKNNMYDFSGYTPVSSWTVKDKIRFKNLLLKISIDVKKNELSSKIAQLKCASGKIKPKQLEKEVDAINMEIMGLSKKSLEQVALPIEQEYDWAMIADKLNKRHKATEYQSLWKIFLHPSINKTKWDKVEHMRLQEIVHQHNFQDWEAIAKELNTGRTAYQCFVYFRAHKANSFTKNKWAKEEEEYLTRLIEFYKENEYIPWGKVATAMENRTKIQVYNKYLSLVEKRKGRFLPEEDAVILTCLDNFGLNFKKITEYLPGRSARQIRIRYGVLSKNRISTVWTLQEDKKLLLLMANEDSVSNYASVSKHFPGKTRAHVRARYMTLQKWMKNYPHAPLDNAPRRGARRLGHGIASENLNKAMEKLKKRIEIGIGHSNSKKITRESPLEVIEDAITAKLLTEQIKEEEVYDKDEMLVLNDESLVSAHALNTTNLQKLIIFLRGKLKQELFERSDFADQYPGLLDFQQQVNLFQLKSYSKKQITAPAPIKLEGTPDTWGNNTLSTLTYVLPPQYATLTGCRMLMSYVSTNFRKDAGLPLFNINALMKRNRTFKEQMALLMERFNTLFLYPLLLSDEGPERVGKLAPQDDQEAGIDSHRRLKSGKVCRYHSKSIPVMPASETGESSSTDGLIDLASKNK